MLKIIVSILNKHHEKSYRILMQTQIPWTLSAILHLNDGSIFQLSFTEVLLYIQQPCVMRNKYVVYCNQFMC